MVSNCKQFDSGKRGLNIVKNRLTFAYFLYFIDLYIKSNFCDRCCKKYEVSFF